MKMQTIFAAVMAAAMMPNLASAAWSETTYTYQVNGVEWRFLIDEDAHTAALGTNQTSTTLSSDAVTGSYSTVEALSGKVIIPEAFTIDGVSYRVVNIGNRAFSGSKSSGLTSLTFPSGVTYMYDAVFYNFDSIESLCFKGPMTVAAGTQETLTLSGNGIRSRSNGGTPALKTVFVGPHITRRSSGYNLMEFKRANGCTYFFPRSSDASVSPDWPGGELGTNPNVIYYGPNEELEFKMGGTALTATVRTANALTNVLNHVATFKNDFGLDTKINVTNSIEVASDLITAENMQYATFNSLMLKVTTQEQLTGILSVIPDSVPLAIDASDAKVELTLPQGREIYVRVSAEGKQGKYIPKVKGLIIAFH